MERDEFLAELRELSVRGHGAAGFKPAFISEQKLLAEFDRSKAENKATEASRQAYIKILDETMLENEELQSWLDRICAPIMREYPTMRSLSLEEVKAEEKVMLEVYRLVWAYLDSQRPSEKPNHVHSDDGGIFWEGREEDCPICNPKSKPLTQCPECIWGQKIVYLNG